MPIDVTMPKLSDTMEEGKILRWLKQPGDRVAVGDVLAEVETDKANMELEAFDDGTLAELRTPEGASAPVGAVIATLAAPGEDAAAAPKPAPAKPVAAKPAPAPPKPAPRPAPAASPARAPEPAREPRRPTPLRRAESEPALAPPPRVRVSPLARRIANEHGVDLTTLEGTGPDGRIVERDVRAALGGAPPGANAAPDANPARASS